MEIIDIYHARLMSLLYSAHGGKKATFDDFRLFPKEEKPINEKVIQHMMRWVNINGNSS